MQVFYGWGDVLQRARHNWRLMLAIGIPILLLPIPLFLQDHVNHGNLIGTVHEKDPNRKFRCLYVICIMAAYWTFEVLPLAITAMLSLIFFPILQVQEAAEVSTNYMKESNMIFLGAIVVALAIEFSGLHIRCALTIIRIFGTRPPRIMIGTMLTTGFMSMWISDTSCTTMLIPILSAISSAMFREEQSEDHQQQVQLDHEGDQMLEPEGFHASRRNRRVSTVFANAALSGHSPVRRSRRSYESAQLGSFHSAIHSRPMTMAPPANQSSPSSARNTYAFSGTGSEEEMKGKEAPMKKGKQPMRKNSVKPTEDKMGVISEGVVALPVPEEEEKLPENLSKVTLREPSPPGFQPRLNYLQRLRLRIEAWFSNAPIDEEQLHQNIRKMLLFAVAYSANIGGTGTLIGTGPVKIFKELNKHALSKEALQNFTQVTSFLPWMAFTIPPIIINISIVWFFLTFRYYGLRNTFHHESETNRRIEKEKVREYLAEEHKKLGPMTAHEISVLCVFILIVALWILRDPQIFPGWGDWFWDTKKQKTKTGDSTPAMFAVALLFLLPKDWSFLDFKKPFQSPAKYEALLDWKFVSANAPWGYVLLIGSGYAIADASEKSGLSHFIGDQLEDLRHVPAYVLLLVVMIVTSLITEVVSNTACATLLIPVLFSMSCSTEINIHPSFLTMASAITASYAFMLPISSPPNGIIFATGELTVKEMLFNGLCMNISCTIVLFFAMIFYGDAIFQFSRYKELNLNCSSAYSYNYNVTYS